MIIGIDVRCLMSRNYTGVAQYAVNLLTNLFKIDRHNQYKLFYNAASDVSSSLPKFPYPNVQFYGFNYPNKFFNSSLRFLHYPKIDQMIQGCDLFFTPNLNFLSLSSKTKKAITVHDLSFQAFPQFFSPVRLLRHFFLQPAKLINSCDKIIVDSLQTQADLISAYKVEPKKIKVIYLGVDHELYHPIDKNHPKLKIVSDKYQLPEHFIFYIGAIQPRKNVESIIQSFELFKQQHPQSNISLVIAGEKSWDFKLVERLAQKSIYKEQIKFIGYVDENDKPCLYNLAEVLLFPSFYEGFGLPVIEAQACGLPVITSSNSSLAEIAVNSAFLVNPDNLTEITQALNYLLTDNQLRQQFITLGLANAQRFTWTKCAQETLNFLIS